MTPISANVSGVVGGNGLDSPSASNNSGGGGGGGEGGGGALTTGATAITSTAQISGANGGNGGNSGASGNLSGSGGSGGAGGTGVVLTGGATFFNNAAPGVQAGAGGNGGNSGTSGNRAGRGGDAGAGGAGVLLTNGGAVLNSGSIQGGNGGAAGTAGGGAIGNLGNGNAGAGVAGANVTVINSGTITGGLANGGAGAQANAITFTGGSNVVELQAGSTISGNVVGTGTDTLRLGGSANSSFNVSNIGAAAQYQGFDNYVKTGTSTWTLTGTTTAVTRWTINQGTLSISADNNLGAASGALTLNGGTLQTTGGGFVLSSSRVVTLGSLGGTFDIQGGVLDITQGIGGTGGLTKIGSGGLVLVGTNTYGGATAVNAGALSIDTGNGLPASTAATVNSGASLFFVGNQTIGSLADGLGGGGTVAGTTFGTHVLTTGNDNSSTSFSGVIQDGGIGSSTALTKIGTGTFILTGNNAYTGATNVNAGVLVVNGSIATSSLTNVNNGSALTGIGTVGNTLVNAGGIFAPGNGTPASSMAVSGNLVFQSAAQYLVQVNPATSSFANVTGTATLGGATVNAVYANGSYVAKQYTIITATGGVSGTFASLANTNLPANFSSSLSYDAHDAFLNLTLNFTPPSAPNFGGGLNGNQQSVGNALINFFNATGSIPLVFGTLTPAGLTQASGEAATGSQQTTFDAMNQFMGVLTDPFIDGRGGATPFAEEDDDASAYAAKDKRSKSERDAYAAIYRKAPTADTFTQRWSVRCRRRLSILTVHAGRLRARRRRHQFFDRQRPRHRTFRSVPGRSVCPSHRRPGVHFGGARIWLAGHHHRSHRDHRWRRPPARGVQRQRIFGARRRRLPFCHAVDKRHRHHPLRRRTVHDVRSTGLRRSRGVRRKYLRALLWRKGCHRVAFRSRPAHRQIIRGAGRDPHAARPISLGA